MGSKRWRLANKKKPSGRLDQVKDFLATPGELAACSIVVPIDMNEKKAVLAAGGLASAGIRSFEVWWDADEKKMEFVLVAEKNDLAAYKQAFLNMYPNSVFSDMSNTVPGWFDESECQIFDVGTYHGHYSAVFDRARAHQLITQVANTVQLSRHAWIQIVFKHHTFGPFLRKHVGRLDEKVREIKRGRYLSNTEIIMNPDKKPHEHPEMGYDFTNNYGGLQKHATLKMQSAQLLMSIRGMIRSDRDIDLNFDEIEALPVENIHSGHEHLTKFRYKYQNFLADEPKKTRIRVADSREKMPRIGIFRHRLLPDPGKFLDGAIGRYFDKGILGYREREPLPFLILNLEEIPLLVHLPEPVTPNIDTTRGVMIPSKPSLKAGACVGFFKNPEKGFDWKSLWGGIDRSKDLNAAVISPTDFATHVYAVGASGSGKTSLIRLFAKHLEMWNHNGKFPNAFIYVDPKGDDSHKFVRQCEAESLTGERIHFLDPQKTKFSINPLELPAHSPWEREEVVSRYVGYFMKTIEEWYQQSASYVQMERIFRALLFYIYMRHDAPTFLDIHDIILRLQDNGVRAMPHIIQTFGTPDPEMKQALTSIATLKGDAFTPLLNRVEQFATDPVLKRMFSVRRGTVDFGELIKPGRQTIVRISPLNMPQHVQPLAMQAFILKLWFTIQERANRVPDESERTQVVLALDEFQIVKDLQVLQLMLEQARSLGLGLVLSHQTTEQISDKQLGIISGNSGTQMIGKVNGKDASRIAQIWDPQFQRELLQQLASQEYFHWTVREKAPPGQEQPPPMQFWLSPPPEILVGEAEYDAYIAAQLARYGGGSIGQNSIAQAGRERNRWIENIEVEFPTKMEWDIMRLLSGEEMRQAQIVNALKVQNRDEVVPVLKEMEEHGRIERTGAERTSPYRLAEKTQKAYFEFDYAQIGTAPDIPEVSKKAIEAYLDEGLFVAMASQRIKKGRDRTDLVAYNYTEEIAISVEIESLSEVQSHQEHVRYNMTKWPKLGFSECHVWSKSYKIRQIRDGLDDEERKKVSTVVISS